MPTTNPHTAAARSRRRHARTVELGLALGGQSLVRLEALRQEGRVLDDREGAPDAPHAVLDALPRRFGQPRLLAAALALVIDLQLGKVFGGQLL